MSTFLSIKNISYVLKQLKSRQASMVAQTVKNLPAMQETGFHPWVGKMPWRRKWQSIPIFMPGKSQRQRNLAGCSPWSHKELNMTEQLSIAEASQSPSNSLPKKICQYYAFYTDEENSRSLTCYHFCVTMAISL